MPLRIEEMSRFANAYQIMILIELKIDTSFKVISGIDLYSDTFLAAGESKCCFKFNVSSSKQIRLWLSCQNCAELNLIYSAMIFDPNKVCLYGHPMSSLSFSEEFKYELLFESGSYFTMAFPLTIMCYLVLPNTDEKIVPDSIFEKRVPDLEVNKEEASGREIVPSTVKEEQTTKQNNRDNVATECLQELSVNFKKLLDQAISTDITIHVDDVSMKAHKLILRARSPVFEKMFDHDTSEAVKNEIDIKDIRAPIMKELLTFLYTGFSKENHDFDSACDLYYAADKYEVLSLRNACAKDLLGHLQVDNACQLLSLATNHGDESLKGEILEYIKTNFKSIVATKSFEELAKYDANLVVLLMRNHMLSNSEE